MKVESAVIGLLVAVFALALSAALTPVSRLLAYRLGALDEPGGRKSHRTPMPRAGGIAVFVAFTATVITGYLLAPRLAATSVAGERFADAFRLLQEAHRVEGKLAAILIAGGVVFLVGLLDDVFGVRFPVAAKLAGQILAATLLAGSGVRTSFLPYDWMNIVVTLVWIVGITNAFNLLDNMDGLSAGVAFVASLVFMINAWLLGEFFVSLILLAFMGSLLGFLFFNFSPARIFLGDCGSLFIGFMMSSLTLLERYVSHASSTLFPVFMPLLVLAVPIADTLTVVVIRLRAHRPVYVGDRCHLSHRLMALGFSVRTTAALLYLATFCLGLGAVLLSDATLGKSVLILVQALSFIALLLLLMFLKRNGFKESW
ncbi:MAG: undecaprenyl/decaprenyl-phosphate alpha-N-acetylglucosaminyl 1-phosphate transferase [Vicinamibacteria bacterium]|nr:undecaprenyl/decaprenyl-phosphate alpha-N-acetylglucosaminyl 1-phosphate transferase [Vicinamibacteria bacterium]